MTNRAFLGFQVVDLAGNFRRGQEVWIYETDGTTPLAATMYAANTGGTTLTNPLTSDAQGTVTAYITTGQRAIASAGGIQTPVNFETDPANYLTLPISPSLFTGHAANRVLGTTDDATLTMFQITQAMIATGAVTNIGVASGAATAPTAPVGSYSTLNEMDITLSCKGGTVLLFFLGSFSHSVAGKYVSVGFDIDASGSAQFVQSPVEHTNDAPFQVMAMGWSLAGSLTGSASSPVNHRFRTLWSTDGATATARAAVRFMVALELRV